MRKGAGNIGHSCPGESMGREGRDDIFSSCWTADLESQTQRGFLIWVSKALVVKNPPANVGDAGSIPGLGISPSKGNGNPLPYSCLENLMDSGA